MGQESLHGLAGSCAPGLRRMQPGCQMGYIHIYKLDWGKICSQDNSDCFQNSLPCWCLRAQMFGWLAAGGCLHVLWDTFSSWRSLSPSRGNPHFPAMWISQHGSESIMPARRNSSCSPLKQNLIMWSENWNPIIFAIFCWEAKARSCL